MNISILESMGKRFNVTINNTSLLVKEDPSDENIKFALETFDRMRVHIIAAHKSTGVDGFQELLELMKANEKIIRVINTSDEEAFLNSLLDRGNND